MRYVDDIFLIFNDRDDAEFFLEFMNSQDSNIKFTLEMENNDSLPFLDVLITRSEDMTISTSIYRKDTFSGLLMQYDSFLPPSFKRNLISGLIYRAWKICSSEDLFQQELIKLKKLLNANGFPLGLINRQIKLFLHKQETSETKSTHFGPEKRVIFLSLPFCGENSIKLSRQIGRITNKIAPWSSVKIVFRHICRLKNISKLKSAISVLNRSNVIYKINCQECSEFYIGLTTRRLKTRIDEHRKRTYSAVFKHAKDSSHSIDFSNPHVLATDTLKLRLQVKETLLIKQYAAHKSLNVNTESFECKLW